MPNPNDTNVTESEPETPDEAVEAYIAELNGNTELADDEAAIKAAETDKSESEVEAKPEDEEELEVVADAPDDKEKAALDRISAREEALRTAEGEFDKRVTETAKQKFADLKGRSYKELLKNAGEDEELVFKRMLLERVSEDKPELKKKLEAELKDYHTNKKIQDLEETIKSKDEAETAAKYIAEYTSQARSYVDKVDEKVAPSLSKLVKSGKGDYVLSKVLAEVQRDASVAFARGEDRDVLTPEQAVKAVEKEIAILAEVFAKPGTPLNEAKKVSISNPKTPPKTVTIKSKTQAEEDEELLERGIKAGLSTAAKLRMAERNKR